MPARNTFNVSTPGFIADHGSLRLVPTGRQIDWATVPAGFVDADTGKKVIRAGTPMVQIDATGLLIPRPAGLAVAGQTPVGLLASDAHEDFGPGRTESRSGYGVINGGNVYENLLPVTLDADTRNAMLNLAGGGFAFFTHSDNRAS